MTKMLHQPFVGSLKSINWGKSICPIKVAFASLIFAELLSFPGIKCTFLYSLNVPILNEKKEQAYTQHHSHHHHHTHLDIHLHIFQ